MKHKLLFSTALVAASMSFAAMANAEIFINNQAVLDSLEDVTSNTVSFDNLAESTDLGSLTLNSDKQVNGQVTLHDRVTLLNGKGDGTADLHVTGWLTETAPGSDTSAIRIGVGNGGLVLGNNLTTRSVNFKSSDIVLYYSEDEIDGLGKYAINPEKTLETSGHIRIEEGTTKIRASKDAESQDVDKDLETKTSLVLNGTGSVVVEGDATLEVDRKTTFNIDVTGDLDEEDNEGTGSLIANADIINNATIANDVTINAGKAFENNGTLSGAVTNAGTLNSALTGLTGTVVNNGALQLTSGGTLKDGIITNNATLGMHGNYTLGEAVTLGGSNIIFETLNLDKYTFNGDLILADGSTLAFNFGENDSKVAGTVSIGQNNVATLKPIFANGFNAESTESHTYADEVSFAEPVGQAKKGELKIANSLYNVDFERNDDGTVKNYNVLTVSKKDTNEISESTGANANQAAAISAVIDGANTGNAAFDAVANNINEMLQSGDAAQVQAALDTVTAMSPEAAPVATSVASETIGQVFGAISSRMSGGSIASANRGMSSGDSLLEKGAAWVQTLVNRAKLKQTADNGGFKSNTAGIALGFEKQISDEVKAGIGYAYNDGEVKSAQRKSDVDTHTAFAYGEYKPSNWFINGMLSHSWSKYDEKTAVSKAKHDADAIGLQVLTGYDFAFDNTTVTPEIGLRYVHVKQDSYSNSLGANIGGDKSDILTGVFGATVAQNWNLDNGMILKPEARLAFTYDMKNDASNATVLLPNGSSYTVDGKALKRFGVEAGLGLTAEINDHIDLTLGYEGRYRDDYRDHTGLLNAKYKF